jgi:hypothetical protein
MKYLTWFLAAAMSLAAVAPSTAHDRPPLQGSVDVDVVTDGGSAYRSIPHSIFRKGGTQVIKRYLEAEPGKNYSIIVRNSTSERVGVVIAVDGRNIISGGRSDLRSREAMYIVNAGETARYEGWRTAQDEVHRFYFTDSGDSYAMRTFGDSSAMGLIAVAVFREKEHPRDISRRGSIPPQAVAPPVRDKAGAATEQSAGTGFGDSAYSPALTVAFEAERSPVQKTLVKYEWREVLCRKGIVYCGETPRNRLWDNAQYAPFPPGY